MRYLAAGERLNLAKIEKRARPPFRPIPIEKPFAEAMIILLSFSQSFNGIASESRRNEENDDEGGSGLAQFEHFELSIPHASSPRRPPFSPEKHAQQRPSTVAPSPDGDMAAIQGLYDEVPCTGGSKQ